MATAFFNNLQTNKHMRMFMDLCNKHGIRMGLISYASSNIIMQTRIQWVYQKYGYELENYCVGSREGKLDMLKAIQQTYWKGNKTVGPNDTGILYSPRQILIIDDVGQTLQEAADNNFSACTPMEVVNFIEDRQNTIGGIWLKTAFTKKIKNGSERSILKWCLLVPKPAMNFDSFN